MATYLNLNQPFVFNGLGTLTSSALTAGQYNVKIQATLPTAIATGDGAGSGTGLGSGTGGGGEGFTGGDLGLGHGGVGQGFGPTNGYQQPPAYGSNQTSGPAVSSSVVFTINKNGSPIYTSTAPTPTQSNFEVTYPFQAALNDVITVVMSSAAGVDNQLNTVKSTITLGQGYQ